MYLCADLMAELSSTPLRASNFLRGPMFTSVQQPPFLFVTRFAMQVRAESHCLLVALPVVPTV